MSNVQYTIRRIPKSLDALLRRKARESGLSLNRTVLDYIKKAAEADNKPPKNDLSWFIGSNTIDDTSLKAIQEMKHSSKTKQRRDENQWPAS